MCENVKIEDCLILFVLKINEYIFYEEIMNFLCFYVNFKRFGGVFKKLLVMVIWGREMFYFGCLVFVRIVYRECGDFFIYYFCRKILVEVVIFGDRNLCWGGGGS